MLSPSRPAPVQCDVLRMRSASARPRLSTCIVNALYARGEHKANAKSLQCKGIANARRMLGCWPALSPSFSIRRGSQRRDLSVSCAGQTHSEGTAAIQRRYSESPQQMPSERKANGLEGNLGTRTGNAKERRSNSQAGRILGEDVTGGTPLPMTTLRGAGVALGKSVPAPCDPGEASPTPWELWLTMKLQCSQLEPAQADRWTFLKALFRPNPALCAISPSESLR